MCPAAGTRGEKVQEKQRLWGFFAHAGIITGVMIVVLFVIDRYNPAMEFMTSEQSKWLILLLALTAVGNGLYSAVLLFQRQKRQEERRFAHRAPAPRQQPYLARQQGIAAPYARGYERPSAPALRAEQAVPRQNAARR